MHILPDEIAEGLPEVFIELVAGLDTSTPEDWARQDALVEKTRHEYWSSNPEVGKSRFIHAFDNWLAYQRSFALANSDDLCRRFENTHCFNPADEENGLNAHRLRLAEMMAGFIQNTHGKTEFTWSSAWLGDYVQGHRRSYLFYSQMFDPLYPLDIREEWLIEVLTRASAEYPAEDEDYRGANLALTMLTSHAKEQSLKNMIAYWIIAFIDSPFDDDGRLHNDLLKGAPPELQSACDPAKCILELYAPNASATLQLAKSLEMDMSAVLNGFRHVGFADTKVSLPQSMDGL